MKANGNYLKGVGYALNKLGDIPNVYNYIDAGHHGWLGWDDNFGPSADIFKQARRPRARPWPTSTGSSRTPPTTAPCTRTTSPSTTRSTARRCGSPVGGLEPLRRRAVVRAGVPDRLVSGGFDPASAC
jgi:hypothetical protein